MKPRKSGCDNEREQTGWYFSENIVQSMENSPSPPEKQWSDEETNAFV